MVMDLLGTIIGFVTVMLVLSLIVMSATQATQALFRNRGRNLILGLSEFLEQQGVNVASIADRKKSARDLLNKRIGLGQTKGDMLARFANALAGPAASYVDPKDVINFVVSEKKIADTDTSAIAEIEAEFARLEDRLRVRFVAIMRVTSIFWAVLVAGYYQVNAIDLLRELSVNPELREKYVAASGGILSGSEQILSRSVDTAAIPSEALEKLMANNTDIASALEEMSGIGNNPSELVAEVTSVIGNNPGRIAELQSEYQSLLDEAYQAAETEALDRSKGYAAALNLRPWAEGWSFYKRPGNIIGALVTIAFLTLGAPFWYERLKDLSQLRDLLAPKK